MLRRKVDGSLVNVTDRGRVMSDIFLGLLFYKPWCVSTSRARAREG
jgi:hypothetical protein